MMHLVVFVYEKGELSHSHECNFQKSINLSVLGHLSMYSLFQFLALLPFFIDYYTERKSAGNDCQYTGNKTENCNPFLHWLFIPSMIQWLSEKSSSWRLNFSHHIYCQVSSGFIAEIFRDSRNYLIPLRQALPSDGWCSLLFVWDE